jgi:multidrug resistance efflux pump
MNDAAPTSPYRWRLPLLACLGAALLIGSFTVAALALRAADNGTTQPGKTDSLAEKTGRKTVAAGTVDTREGVSTVLPLLPGKVAKVIAKENQEFDEGAALYLMDDRQARSDRDAAEAAVRAAEAQLDEARSGVDQHKTAVAAQQAVIQAKQKKHDAAQKEADDAKRLAEKKLASSEKADAAQNIADAADAEVEAERQNLRRTEKIDPEIAVKKAEQDLAAKQAQLAKAQLALDECTVKAPYKGKVLRVQLTVGDSLPNPRQAPLLYCSNTPRIVRAEIEQEFGAKVFVGQPAKIKDYSAEDLGEWKGRVESLSDWYTHRRSMILEPLQFNDVRTLEAIIELDPGQTPLKIGQRVRVTLPVAPQ